MKDEYTNLKFNIGDLVKVINPTLNMYGKIGKIVDTDEEWYYPYEVEWEEHIKSGMSIEDVEDLFEESDLEKVHRYDARNDERNDARNKATKWKKSPEDSEESSQYEELDYDIDNEHVQIKITLDRDNYAVRINEIIDLLIRELDRQQKEEREIANMSNSPLSYSKMFNNLEAARHLYEAQNWLNRDSKEEDDE